VKKGRPSVEVDTQTHGKKRKPDPNAGNDSDTGTNNLPKG